MVCFSIAVPTRHGVQKPQLVREKCTKLRPLEQVAAVVEHMNAPAVGGLRSPVCGRTLSATHTPEGPLTCTARVFDRTAVLQHLAHRHAERIFVMPGRGQSPDTEISLLPEDFCRADGAVVLHTHLYRQRGAAEGLDVVHGGRLLQVAVRHRERRAAARHAALAFQRLDQRRFLAADVGARPAWMAISKSKPG